MADEVDVAIVGGGPAGAATATHLARLGYRVAILERHAKPRWRACGVFASPLVRSRLIALGLGRDLVADLHRPISAMELRSARGQVCNLEYRAGFACGFDRTRLDQELLEHAGRAGAEVHRECVVREVVLGSGRNSHQLVIASTATGGEAPPDELIQARVVVGADGRGSRVARAAGVASERSWLGRAGITFHVRDMDAAPQGVQMTGTFVLGAGWYVGLAPVPGDRVNVGIVVPTERLQGGVEPVVDEVMAAASRAHRWSTAPRTDEAQVAGRLEHHVTRAAGHGWLLVGDAIEFIDPLTGEGLHRALVTAALAAEAIDRWLSTDQNAFAVYDRRVRSRFRSKNVFSLVLQAFIAKPVVLDYALRRLERRVDLRQQLTAVLADQAPASKALDPRFLARVLAP